MVSDLEQRLLQREMEVVSDADLVRWARGAIRGDGALAADPNVGELASLQFGNPRLVEARALLRGAVVRANPEFSPLSPDAQAFGRACLLDACRRFLAEDLPPYELCRLVDPIEQTFDHPVWLGDLYNHCDWCEPSSTRSHFGHLVEYVSTFLAESSDAPP
jgi:hypothetical protein